MTDELVPLKPKPVLGKYSRFGGQQTFQNVDGRMFFGTFNPPAFPVSPTDTFHTVRQGEPLRLDLLSYQFYRTPELWWVLALVNDILSPFDDIEIGDVLRVPSLSTVTTYLSNF